MASPTYTGKCEGGPRDGKDLRHRDIYFPIFEKKEFVGKYRFDDGKWIWKAYDKEAAEKLMAEAKSVLDKMKAIATKRRSTLRPAIDLTKAVAAFKSMRLK